MKKNKQIKRNFKFFCIKSYSDIDDVIGILLEDEASILVDLSKCNLNNYEINEVIDCIELCQNLNMRIMIKKIFPKVVVCWSAHSD